MASEERKLVLGKGRKGKWPLGRGNWHGQRRKEGILLEGGARNEYFFIMHQILNDEFSLVEEIFTPYFVETIIIVYFDDSSKYIDIIEQALMEEAPLDLAKLDEFLNLLKRCSRFGAQRLPIEINKVLECCNANDKEGCKKLYLKRLVIMLEIEVTP
ncbi:pseudo histidine-containing phosphotransfer protein 2-like isoform X2 [Carya illinoinensis]|uniref:pseudo histidine-containing phosphotransfer protein 2-like isoform X2 n=1 Tax=Carya illinoinensis TaxID=32201 RepID=UPI001C72038F|nr:pseudo histidine-containing phosphotransfer protein 2-like isoform X2 [Carya illinoinensis]